MNYLTYQEQLQDKAARGLARWQYMQKVAVERTSPGVGETYSTPEKTNTIDEHTEPGNWLESDYARYGLPSAGVGALIGGLVNLVRKKNVLSGALIGAGIGGLGGIGHAKLRENADYATNNALDKYLYDPVWKKINELSGNG